MPRILAVDDEPHIRQLLEVILMRAGYTVTMAVDLREALMELDKEPPDAVILGLFLPYPMPEPRGGSLAGPFLPPRPPAPTGPALDAWDVLNSIRRNPSTQCLPVILLHAKRADWTPDAQRAEELLEKSKEPYLLKPFSPQELLIKLESILQA